MIHGLPPWEERRGGEQLFGIRPRGAAGLECRALVRTIVKLYPGLPRPDEPRYPGQTGRRGPNPNNFTGRRAAPAPITRTIQARCLALHAKKAPRQPPRGPIPEQIPDSRGSEPRLPAKTVLFGTIRVYSLYSTISTTSSCSGVTFFILRLAIR